MLFQTALQNFFNWFPRSAGWLLIIGGALAITWLGYERKRRGGFVRFKNEDWENTEVSKFLRIMSYFGLILGVIMIWSAVIGLLNHIPPSFAYRDHTEDNFDLLTSISLLIVGCVCFMKPINDLPWAGIIGIFAGIISGIYLSFYIPEYVSAIFQPEMVKWVSVIVGVVIASLVGVLLKFYVGSLQTASRILSWPPIALFVAAYCILQGIFLLVWGFSMGNYPAFLANLG